MKILYRTTQPVHVIARRFFGKLHNGKTFHVDLWKEEENVVVVVYCPEGRALASLKDLPFEDRATINNVIVRHAAPLFGCGGAS